MTEEHHSPLHDWHVGRDAEFLWEDGWPWIMHEGGDPLQEYEAIRTGTGLWDLFSTCKYEVTGPDSARLIQRRFTNSLEGMESGQVRYGAFVNADGLMIDDGNVYKHDDRRYWVMINTPGIEDWFMETGQGLDADVTHRTEELEMIAVQGPTSQETLQPLTGRALGDLRYFRFWPERTTVAGKDVSVQRTGFSGEKGYEVVCRPEDAPEIWEALIGAGGVPFGLTAADLARTEVGLVVIAVDYTPGETSPYDLSMDRFIATDTECVGAAALASYGARPPKRFKSLRIEGDAVPEYGAAVLKEGAQVGVVTSPAASPRLGTIALAIMDADMANDGQHVEVALAGGTAPAKVDAQSPYDPEKVKPRG